MKWAFVYKSLWKGHYYFQLYYLLLLLLLLLYFVKKSKTTLPANANFVIKCTSIQTVFTMFYQNWTCKSSSLIYLFLGIVIVLLVFANYSFKSSILWTTSYSNFQVKRAKNIVYSGSNKELEAKAQLWENELRKHYQTMVNQNEVINKKKRFLIEKQQLTQLVYLWPLHMMIVFKLLFCCFSFAELDCIHLRWQFGMWRLCRPIERCC